MTNPSDVPKPQVSIVINLSYVALGPEPGGDAGVVAFQAELVLQGPDDGFDALA